MNDEKNNDSKTKEAYENARRTLEAYQEQEEQGEKIEQYPKQYIKVPGTEEYQAITRQDEEGRKITTIYKTAEAYEEGNEEERGEVFDELIRLYRNQDEQEEAEETIKSVNTNASAFLNDETGIKKKDEQRRQRLEELNDEQKKVINPYYLYDNREEINQLKETINGPLKVLRHFLKCKTKEEETANELITIGQKIEAYTEKDKKDEPHTTEELEDNIKNIIYMAQLTNALKYYRHETSEEKAQELNENLQGLYNVISTKLNITFEQAEALTSLLYCVTFYDPKENETIKAWTEYLDGSRNPHEEEETETETALLLEAWAENKAPSLSTTNVLNGFNNLINSNLPRINNKYMEIVDGKGYKTTLSTSASGSGKITIRVKQTGKSAQEKVLFSSIKTHKTLKLLEHSFYNNNEVTNKARQEVTKSQDIGNIKTFAFLSLDDYIEIMGYKGKNARNQAKKEIEEHLNVLKNTYTTYVTIKDGETVAKIMVPILKNKGVVLFPDTKNPVYCVSFYEEYINVLMDPAKSHLMEFPKELFYIGNEKGTRDNGITYALGNKFIIAGTNDTQIKKNGGNAEINLSTILHELKQHITLDESKKETDKKRYNEQLRRTLTSIDGAITTLEYNGVIEFKGYKNKAKRTIQRQEIAKVKPEEVNGIYICYTIPQKYDEMEKRKADLTRRANIKKEAKEKREAKQQAKSTAK